MFHFSANYFQKTGKPRSDTTHTLTSVPHVWAKITPHMQDSTVNSECSMPIVTCLGAMAMPSPNMLIQPLCFLLDLIQVLNASIQNISTNF
jgi:hypothetical protein